MRRRQWFRAVALVVAMGSGAAFAGVAQEPSDAAAVVNDLLAAYNAHDPDAIAALVTEDVGWYSIEGDAIRPEARGRDAVRAAMSSYFELLPSAESEFAEMLVSGRYVIVRERVSWEQDGERRSQSALAVYEITDGLVANVWYFPAEAGLGGDKMPDDALRALAFISSRR